MMNKNGVTYRIIKDHLGSPRLVINTSSGTIEQRVDYNEWGRVLADTNAGFISFGLAGGLRDLDSGLVRFGARDYSPQTTRWISKDPIGFNGGDANLYRYAGNDPVNFIDTNGLQRQDEAFAVYDMLRSDLRRLKDQIEMGFTLVEVEQRRSEDRERKALKILLESNACDFSKQSCNTNFEKLLDSFFIEAYRESFCKEP